MFHKHQHSGGHFSFPDQPRPAEAENRRAEAESAEAFDWYERRVPALGADFLAAVDVALDSLPSHPLQRPVVHRAVRRALTRRLPYQVLFLVEEHIIVVTAVLHGGRDPRTWQDRL